MCDSRRTEQNKMPQFHCHVMHDCVEVSTTQPKDDVCQEKEKNNCVSSADTLEHSHERNAFGLRGEVW